MEVTKSGSVVGSPKTTQGKKTARQVCNAAVTAVAAGATATGALSLCKIAYRTLNADKTLRYGNVIERFATKFCGLMSNIGNKIFPKGGKWHNVLAGLVEQREGKITEQMLKTYKGNAAMLLLGGIATIGVIAAGAFKAGKINAEGK